MKPTDRIWCVAIAIVIAGTACQGAGEPAQNPAVGGEPTAALPSPGRSSPGSPVARPSASPRAWQTVPITDVRTGAAFQFTDFADRVVIVESMATWCPPCREQQLQAQLALRRVDAGSVVYVSLDVDPRESPETLRAYAERNRFDWTFAVGTPELLRLLSEDLGDVVLAPPATPVVVIGTDGSITSTELGIKSSDRLVALAKAHGA